MPLRLCCALLLLPMAAALTAQVSPFDFAQGKPLLVAVDEGARLRPVARFDGTRWAVTCDVPTSRASGSGGARPSRVIVSAGLAVEAIRSVTVGGTEWRQLEPLVKQLFQARERQENVAPAALASVPLSIDAIFSSAPAPAPQGSVSGNGSTPFLYYFRASKTIPDSRGDVDADDDGEVDPKGDLRLEVTGWLRRDSELRSLGTNAALSWEQVDDRPQAGTRRSDLTPIGILRAAGAHVWVMQGRAGSSIWYTLYEVDGGGSKKDASRPVRLLVRTDPREC